MEFVITLVVLLVGAGGVWFFYLVFKDDHLKKQSLARADEILDATFDGTPQVTYASGHLGALPRAMVIDGGSARGYSFTGDTNGTLVFTRRASETLGDSPS